MTDLLRQEVTATADLVVVKVGTRVVTLPDGKLNKQRISDLAEQICKIEETGRRVVLVSSGAVGAGMSELGLEHRPTDVATLQAVAAIGQTKLIQHYEHTLRKHGRHAAQVLLTADDLDVRSRYLNIRNTVFSLLEFGALPIINENDTVAVEELMATFGDNDHLAARVTNFLRAPLLIILSDVDGVFDGDPSLPESKLVSTITELNGDIFKYVRDKTGGTSKGGMASKLEAAHIVTQAGENMIIASGNVENILVRLLNGECLGTLITAQGKSITPRKRWIGFSAQTCGSVVIDAGAVEALRTGGKSLLSIGVVDVKGSFSKGDVVSVSDQQGHEIARGLTNYSTSEIQQIKGLNSSKIADVLGHQPYDEVVHRNNMTLVKK